MTAAVKQQHHRLKLPLRISWFARARGSLSVRWGAGLMAARYPQSEVLSPTGREPKEPNLAALAPLAAVS